MLEIKQQKQNLYTVGICFEVLNGLLGMKRDIILNLCHLTEMRIGISSVVKDTIIKAVFGIGQECLLWKNHSFFKNNRIRFIHPPSTPELNSFRYIEAEHTPGGELCIFEQRPFCTAFMDKDITEGIFDWTIKIRYEEGMHTFFCLGVAPMAVSEKCENCTLRCLYGACGFYFWRGADGSLASHLCGVCNGADISYTETPVPDGAMVIAEVDADAHTLSFFVNGQRVPRSISKIPTPLHLGVSGWRRLHGPHAHACPRDALPSVLSVSFARLAFPRPPHVAVTPHPPRPCPPPSRSSPPCATVASTVACAIRTLFSCAVRTSRQDGAMYEVDAGAGTVVYRGNVDIGAELYGRSDPWRSSGWAAVVEDDEAAFEEAEVWYDYEDRAYATRERVINVIHMQIKTEEMQNVLKEAGICRVPFLRNPKGGCLLTGFATSENGVCSFTQESSYRTVFVDNGITEGIFDWTVRIKYSEGRASHFWIGAAPCSLLDTCADHALGHCGGVGSFYFWRDDGCSLGSYLIAKGNADIPETETPVPDGSVVTVEINADARTLSFFVDGKKVPRMVMIARAESPLYLGVSDMHGSSFTFCSFRRLPFPMPALLSCKVYEGERETVAENGAGARMPAKTDGSKTSVLHYPTVQDRYTGQTVWRVRKGRIPHGHGVCVYGVDGSHYEGGWVEGRRAGKGRMTWPSGVGRTAWQKRNRKWNGKGDEDGDRKSVV